MVKTKAERRSWTHAGHRDFYQIVNSLAEETGDRQLRESFNSASALHSNFYENWLPREMVEDRSTEVRGFLSNLGTIL